MLSSVLHSDWAIQVNIAIMDAFVRLRETLASDKELSHKLAELDFVVYKPKHLNGHFSIKTIKSLLNHSTAVR